MTGTPPKGTRVNDGISGATLTLIAISLSELRKDIAGLLDADWPEPLRRRAHELASALWEACRRQGLEEVAIPARSIASLAMLSHDKAAPLREALREKFEELISLAQGHVAKIVKRRTG